MLIKRRVHTGRYLPPRTSIGLLGSSPLPGQCGLPNTPDVTVDPGRLSLLLFQSSSLLPICSAGVRRALRASGFLGQMRLFSESPALSPALGCFMNRRLDTHSFFNATIFTHFATLRCLQPPTIPLLTVSPCSGRRRGCYRAASTDWPL